MLLSFFIQWKNLSFASHSDCSLTGTCAVCRRDVTVSFSFPSISIWSLHLNTVDAMAICYGIWLDVDVHLPVGPFEAIFCSLPACPSAFPFVIWLFPSHPLLWLVGPTDQTKERSNGRTGGWRRRSLPASASSSLHWASLPQLWLFSFVFSGSGGRAAFGRTRRGGCSTPRKPTDCTNDRANDSARQPAVLTNNENTP